MYRLRRCAANPRAIWASCRLVEYRALGHAAALCIGRNTSQCTWIDETSRRGSRTSGGARQTRGFVCGSAAAVATLAVGIVVPAGASCQEAKKTVCEADVEYEVVGEAQLAEIVRAIRSGDVPRAMSLIRERLPSIDAPIDADDNTALSIACAAGRLSVISGLLRAGANPEAVNVRGENCISRASEEGQLEVVKNLGPLKKQVDLNRPDHLGLRPLHKSISARHWKITECLLSLGVSPNLRTTDSDLEPALNFLLHRLSCREKKPFDSNKLPRYQGVEVLLGYGADPKAGDANGDCSLHLCARQGDLVGIWLLLVEMEKEDAAAMVQVQNKAGTSVLQEADDWGADAALTMRLAVWLPRPAKRYIMSWVFWEFLAILRAPMIHRW